jgi:CrcB protein
LSLGGALLVALGAAAGAPLRYLVDRWISARSASPFPWGTFAVNVAGSLVLGALLGAGAPQGVVLALGTGFCGALTTYSAFGYETVRLLEERAYLAAVLNMVGSVTAGVGAAAAGWALLAWLTG